ncbi:MAG: DegT/DnrJ/EryC1/StrS family aminotransferase, partial [Rhodospirillales bacterium]|nr:DegT/DnrJ/EryC1/StrS family aminotransferase [Rhodospirillales bacterium]
STGEGGIITTDDDAFAERLRRLRHQGMSLSDYARHNASPTTFEEYPEIGFNYRITDVQAAIGCAQLDRLDEILMRRKAVAERYTEALADHPLLVAPHVPANAEPNWQSYQVLLRKGGAAERNVLMERLHAQGIPTRRAVMASHREAPYRAMGARLPHTEDIADRGLQLPMHPGLGDDQFDHVIDSLRRLVP